MKMNYEKIRLKEKYDKERDEYRKVIHRQKVEIERLREALNPFAEKYLWPDDSGIADELRSDENWDEERNQEEVDDVWIKRAWIRQARAALKEIE